MLCAPIGKVVSQEICICVLFVCVNKDEKFSVEIQLQMNAAQTFALKDLCILCSALGPMGSTQGPHIEVCCFKAHRRMAA